jgi:alkylated DNA nucleotide flippase Atl1
VSNGPWTTKREALAAHDTLLLNSRLLSAWTEWDEPAIDARSESLIDALLAAWPVPVDHVGSVVDPHEKAAGWIQVKHLVEAGLLQPGTVLNPRPGTWQSRTALVRPDGLLEVDGKTFETPSGAGRFVKNGNTNGWSFWRLDDGRRLLDVREAYSGAAPASKSVSTPDWGLLHTILELLPTGHWTTYRSVADVLGITAAGLGNHIPCQQCVNTHRVLRGDHKVAPTRQWSEASAGPNPVQLLGEEGALVNGRPNSDRELSSDELQALIEQ